MTTVTVSATLATVIAVGWSRILKFEVTRLDDRLCMEVRRLVAEPEHGQDVLRLAKDLTAKLRLASPDQLMLRFESSAGEQAFQSANWSEDISTLRWQPLARRDRPPSGDVPPQEGAPPPNDLGLPDHARGAEPPARVRPTQGECQITSFAAQGKQWRAALLAHAAMRSVVAADIAATEAELQSAYQSALTTVIPLALLLAGLGAWLLSGLTMRPVNRLRKAMKGVTQKALSQRLDAGGEDSEFKDLIAAYNTMLERLELSFRQASRFSSDAAHELQTPLTILQGHLERSLRATDHAANSHHADKSDLVIMLDEVGRLSAITRKLLLLSQADTGHLALHNTRIVLSDTLSSLAQDAQILAVSEHIDSSIALGLVVQGDALLLTQLLNNLVTNAVRYCLPGGRIEVVARRIPAGIEVVFANTTVAIGAQERAQFFDRFYRGEAAHNRQIEGSGLGLSLAREIARAHGGDLTLEPSPPIEVRMRLWLPDLDSKPAL
jgi:two-component system, OmpR family, heavy metal sensor histidine kinase CusS